MLENSTVFSFIWIDFARSLKVITDWLKQFARSHFPLYLWNKFNGYSSRFV